MKLNIWHVDAFAHRPFAGNPAAVVPLAEWLADETMQAIAAENNLSETAFFVARASGRYDLRWFSPAAEVELCGHATLASAFVVLTELAPQLGEVRFSTRSGVLTVAKGAEGLLCMSLPADEVVPFAPPDGFAGRLGASLCVSPPAEFHSGRYLMAVWRSARDIREMKFGPDLAPSLREAGKWGLAATAQDEAPYDFVSRFFAPDMGVNEDPVTGSAHCALAPFWAKRLGKKTLRAYQASARGGELLCTDEGGRVTLSGPCALYLRGVIEV